VTPAEIISPRRIPIGPRPRARRSRMLTWGQRLALIALLAILLFPIYWLIVTSMTTPEQIISPDLSALLPRHLTVMSYRYVLRHTKFFLYVRNSIVVGGAVTILGVSISALAGYGLTRLQFPGSRLLGRLILFAYVAPPVLLAVPMFVLMARLHLVDTPFALILAHMTFAIPFCVWILRGFFLSLPHELEDAAAVDGCSPLWTFLVVVAPLSLPGIVAAAMFAFLLSWNEYFYALVFLLSNSQMTLPIGIQSSFFNLAMGPDDWIHLLSASVLASIPVFLLFGGLQRWMVGGLTAGAVRG
jgi:multiple sugar transport system permease protein